MNKDKNDCGATAQKLSGDIDSDVVTNWIASDQGEKAIKADVETKWSLPCDYTGEGFDREYVYREIETAITRQSHKDKVERKIGRIRRWVAAAVLLPLVVVSVVWLLRDNSFGEVEVIARVVDNVTLTLPDGSEVILNQSTLNGRIAEQDGVTIVHRDGSLIHETTTAPTAATAEIHWVRVDIPRGTQFDLVLEDGTHVWLNAGSRLRFPIAFGGEERRVYLDGEAYFDVTANPQRPFIVETSGQSLRVLGTEFNIQAYEDEDTYTTLIDGRVLLKTAADDREVVLEPGQQAVLLAGSEGVAVAQVNTAEVLAWRNNEFAFDGVSLDKVFTKLQRWYDFEYVFVDPEVAGRTLSGSMPVCEDLNSVLEMIELAGVASVELEGNVVYIKKNR